MDYACCEAYVLTPAGEVCSAEQDVPIGGKQVELNWQKNNRLIASVVLYKQK